MIEAALACLALNIYHEARGEPPEGQIAVALVTLNRARRNLDKVCHEVYRPYQFSWTIKGVPAVQDTAAYRRAYHYAQQALKMKDYTQGATHFHASHISPYWTQSLDFIGQWGNHKFYR